MSSSGALASEESILGRSSEDTRLIKRKPVDINLFAVQEAPLIVPRTFIGVARARKIRVVESLQCERAGGEWLRCRRQTSREGGVPRFKGVWIHLDR